MGAQVRFCWVGETTPFGTAELTVANGAVQTFKVFGQPIVSISRTDVPYTSQGDSGASYEYAISLLNLAPNAFTITGSILRNYTLHQSDSVGTDITRTQTDNIQTSLRFMDDNYSWTNAYLEQSGIRTITTNWLQLYVQRTWTGLILRSAETGQILRDSNGAILRDA